MRLLATFVFLGTSVVISTVRAETPPASVMDAAKANEAAATASRKAPRTVPAGAPSSDSDGSDAASATPTPPPAPPVPTVEAAAPLEFPVKDVTAQDLAGIKVGAREKEVLIALGTPASRIVLADDDGHLRKSYQYWANGKPVGTIRLDNGLVVKVEIRH